jgi:hypothetical protein
MNKVIEKAMEQLGFKDYSYKYEKGYLNFLYKNKEFHVGLSEQLIMHSMLSPEDAIIKLVESKLRKYDEFDRGNK